MCERYKEKEILTVLHWFQGWNDMQKADFMKDLMEKAVPHKISTLFDALETMNFKDNPPSLFKCQMKLFAQYFDGWSHHYRNDFINRIEELDANFVLEFNSQVTATSGQP